MLRFPPHLSNVSTLPCDITETLWSLGQTIIIAVKLLLLVQLPY